MTCRRSFKEKIFSLISYCILYLNHPPNHLWPNFIAHWSLDPQPLAPARSLRNAYPPIALSPQSLPPNSLAWSHPPGHYYSDVLLSTWFIDSSSSDFPKISLHYSIDTPLIDPQPPWSSAVNYLLIRSSDPKIFLSLTRSLIFCCRHWSSAIISSSDFPN